MITKLNINNLGIFKNLNWDNSFRDLHGTITTLKKVNIIYGRNYSGKTTLSRIIRALETKFISDKYISPEFEVIAENHTLINQVNFNSNTLLIRCFNEDFIKENLKFVIDNNDEIKPFAILGENGEVENQIKLKKETLGSNKDGEETLLYRDSIEKNNTYTEKVILVTQLEQTLNTQLSNKATGENGIKQNHQKFGDINYNITKLKADLDKLVKGEVELISNEKKQSNENLLNEIIKPELNNIQNFEVRINYFKGKVQDVVTKEIFNTEKIKELLENSILNNWVKIGYEFHKENNKCECSFCGNKISENRWNELDKHFDVETEKLLNDLKDLQNEITNEIQLIESKKNILDCSLFYSEFHEILNMTVIDLNSKIESSIVDFDKLSSFVSLRIENILKPLNFDFVTEISDTIFIDSIEKLNAIINENKEYSQQLEQKKQTAKIELKLYELNLFKSTILYSEQIEKINEEIQLRDNLLLEKKEIENSIEKIEKQIDDLTRLLNNEEEGAKRVNDYLKNYFGHQNLELKAIEEEIESEKKIRFNITRNGQIAYHLSEGECSLLAFCYFIARLDDIHTNGKKPIILIDDPISSLDSNHIFYLYSLINSELFHKDRFEQIFISTHNLDFLKYLKRLKFERNKHEHFLINRHEDYSSIVLMPSYLKDYITEFNYLFDQIYKCANASIVNDDNHSVYYNFGNNARKFLEAFLFYKYPSKIDNQSNNANSKRLLKFFGNDNQASILTERVNNELSHLEEIFERGMTPIEIPELKRVAQFILNKIEEKDKDQYDALLESIGINQTV